MENSFWTPSSSEIYLDSLYCVKHVFTEHSALFLPSPVTDLIVYDYGYYIYQMSMKRCIWLLSVVKTLLQRKMRALCLQSLPIWKKLILFSSGWVNAHKEREKRNIISCREVMVYFRIGDKKDYGILEIIYFFPPELPLFCLQYRFWNIEAACSVEV